MVKFHEDLLFLLLFVLWYFFFAFNNCSVGKLSVLLVSFILILTSNSIPETLSSNEGSHYFHFKVVGMTRPGIEPATSRTHGGRSIITTSRRSVFLKI